MLYTIIVCGQASSRGDDGSGKARVRVHVRDVRESALCARRKTGAAEARTSPAMAAPCLREVPSGCRDVPRDASRCLAMPRDAERAQGAMPPRCRRMPKASTTFHEPLDLAYLPSTVSLLDFSSVFGRNFDRYSLLFRMTKHSNLEVSEKLREF